MTTALPAGERRPHRPQRAAALHLRRTDLRRLRRRHAGVGPARQRRPPGRAQLQVSPPARDHDRRRGGAQRLGRARAARRAQRPEPARHRGRALPRPQRREPEPLALARARRRRRQRPALAVLPGRLLLQDLLVAGRVVEIGLRARDPPGRRSRRAPKQPDPDRYLHRHAHCDVLVVGAGPAGLMAAAAGRGAAAA